MQYTAPDLFTDLFIRIGDLWVELWTKLIEDYPDIYVFFRMGDDLGHNTSTMLEPDTIRTHIIPQHRRIIDLSNNAGKRFLLHSCGNIFVLMDDLLRSDIDVL
jgi:uroporphyrinogen decarboxylase